MDVDKHVLWQFPRLTNINMPVDISELFYRLCRVSQVEDIACRLRPVREVPERGSLRALWSLREAHFELCGP